MELRERARCCLPNVRHAACANCEGRADAGEAAAWDLGPASAARRVNRLVKRDRVHVVRDLLARIGLNQSAVRVGSDVARDVGTAAVEGDVGRGVRWALAVGVRDDVVVVHREPKEHRVRR